MNEYRYSDPGLGNEGHHSAGRVRLDKYGDIVVPTTFGVFRFTPVPPITRAQLDGVVDILNGDKPK